MTWTILRQGWLFKRLDTVWYVSINEHSVFEKEIQSLKSIFVLEGSFGHMSDIWVDVGNTKDQYFF